MKSHRFRCNLRHPRLAVLSALAGFAVNPGVSRACAVCFGDPNSLLAKGAAAGVLVLVGVISVVLLGVAGTGMFWVHRSRQSAQVVEEAKTESEGKGLRDS